MTYNESFGELMNEACSEDTALLLSVKGISDIRERSFYAWINFDRRKFWTSK